MRRAHLFNVIPSVTLVHANKQTDSTSTDINVLCCLLTRVSINDQIYLRTIYDKNYCILYVFFLADVNQQTLLAVVYGDPCTSETILKPE